MTDDVRELVLRFCTLNSDAAYATRFETRYCFALIKSLIDGEPPSIEPTNPFDFEKASNLYDIIPESLQAQAEKILTSWKLRVYAEKDPDIENPSPPASSVIDIYDEHFAGMYGYGYA